MNIEQFLNLFENISKLSLQREREGLILVNSTIQFYKSKMVMRDFEVEVCLFKII